MGILLWDTICTKVSMVKCDLKIKASQIDGDSVSEALHKVADFAKEQNDSNMKKFEDHLKKQPDSSILHNMDNAGTEEGRRLCRDEARRRGLI